MFLLIVHALSNSKLAFCIDIVNASDLQREYEEFKVRINGLIARAKKAPCEGWVMKDGTPWPGNNKRDHPGMIQVFGLSDTM